MFLIWHKYDNLFHKNGPWRSAWVLCKCYTLDTRDFFKTGLAKKRDFYEVLYFDTESGRFKKHNDEVVTNWAYLDKKESKLKKFLKKIKREGGVAQ